MRGEEKRRRTGAWNTVSKGAKREIEFWRRETSNQKEGSEHWEEGSRERSQGKQGTPQRRPRRRGATGWGGGRDGHEVLKEPKESDYHGVRGPEPDWRG